uniref:Uncharacterized protein n=1 Tax=Arundo donax TaxID=35708 RepID=A0A0A9HU28_ARUDO
MCAKTRTGGRLCRAKEVRESLTLKDTVTMLQVAAHRLAVGTAELEGG